MNNLAQAIGVEFLKARRSKAPLFTALGFSLAPLVGGFFMIVLKDPDFARNAGLISAKAQIAAGTADWPAYLGLLAQAAAVGGLLIFSLVASWVFGREFSDRTAKDLLALPTSRATIVCAKFVIMAAWCAALVALILMIGVVVGAAIGLPGGSLPVHLHGGLTLIITAGLTILLVTPIAFFASAGGGYLPAMGMALLFLMLAQIVAVAGWGEFFPWSIPALYAELGGAAGADLGAISFALVLLIGGAGIAGTVAWWEMADQSQ